jgi:hypothetical protein
MEDHNGDLVLEDGKSGGARISLVFYPMDQTAREDQAVDGEDTSTTDIDPTRFATDMRANG